MKIAQVRRWALLAWIALLVGYLVFLHQRGQSPSQVVISTLHWLKTDPLGPWAFLVAFVARPIILVPASLLAVIAGHCFGAGWGEFWALLAGQIAALFMFSLGRVGGGRGEDRTDNRWGQFRRKLAERGISTTITMRMAMLPYDPVSFLCGSVGIKLGPFLLATLIGNLSGTTSCVLFGAGIKGEFDGHLPSLDWRLQAGAISLLLVAFALQYWIKKRSAISGESNSLVGKVEP